MSEKTRMTTRKKPTARTPARTTGKAATVSRRRPAKATAAPAPARPVPPRPATVRPPEVTPTPRLPAVAVPDAELARVDSPPPETTFVQRVPSPAPPRPHPTTRRAIFFDVENTSRGEHIARVIDHLAVDRLGSATDIVAVGNWKVIGQDTARLLARHGAHLVHSAPSTGVRDWSDLRIAVAAGVWVAGARPGDVLEIISDDRAFDAVGDVAASLGIAYRRLSYRGLTGQPAAETPVERPMTAPPSDGAQRRRRRGRRGRPYSSSGRPTSSMPARPP